MRGATNVEQNVSDIEREVDEAQEAGSSLVNQASRLAEQSRQRLADTLDQAAGRMKDGTASPDAGELRARAADSAAQGLGQASDYLRSHDSAGMMGDARQYMKDHPYRVLAFAALGAFVLGRVMR